MTRRSRIESVLAPFLERMIAARAALERERALLEAAVEVSHAQAAALWARAAEEWGPRLGIGEAETLPDDARVRARLESGGSDALLRSGERVACPAGASWAIVLGGVPERELGDQLEDHLDGLLVVHACLAPPDGDAPAPLPSSDPEPV